MNSIIMFDDNRNAGIAYCEEIQMQAKTTKETKWVWAHFARRPDQ